MAYFSFTEKMVKGQEITLYNKGVMRRDFTYINDVIFCMKSCLTLPPIEDQYRTRYRNINIGSGHTSTLYELVGYLEEYLSVPAKIRLGPLQESDVIETKADISEAFELFNYKPQYTLAEGLKSFVNWYKEYSNIR